ncbi:MAG: MFS transporter [Micromonosporaceae bacterium]|nr:MFS transporter [Micromonosporaceae bacterium]
MFRDRIFTVVFGSRTLSISANTLRMYALSVLVFEQTGSALLTALAFGIGFVPQVIGGTLLGALADRLRPRGLIVAGFLLDGAVAAALALASLPVAASLGLVAVAATLTPIFQGASTRVVAESLTGDAYVLGRSLFNVASAGAQLVGLAVGALAVAQLGPTQALLVTAACQLAAAGWARLGLPRLAALPRVDGAAVGQSWSVTVRLWRDGTVRSLLLVQWLPSACVTGAEALFVPYAAQRGFPAGSAGLLMASVPVGMLLGNVVVGRLVPPPTRERLVAPLLVLLGAPVVGFALPVPLWLTAGLAFLAGVGFSYGLGLQRVFLDALDPQVRGQAFALQFTGMMTLQGVAPLVTGALAEVAPVALAMAVAGLATVVIAVAWRFSDPAVARRCAADAP